MGTSLKQISVKRPTIMYSTLRGFDRIRDVIRAEILIHTEIRGPIWNASESSAGDLVQGMHFPLRTEG